MASSTVRAPGRLARSMRDAPDPAEEGTPAPRLAVRAPHFMPPSRGRGPDDRRLGLFLSVALHVVVLVVLLVTDAVRLPDFASLLDEPDAGGGAGESVVFMPIDGFPGPRTSATPAQSPASTASSEALLIPPAPTADEPQAAARPAQAPPDQGVAQDDGTGGGAGGSGAGSVGADDATARFNRSVEALRPRALDPRLRPGTIDALRTDHERAALRAYARIRALNDSIMAEMEAGRRSTDWTWTDSEGRRWGISPGKLHLGGIEIPLPISTGQSRDQRELMREWEEIQAQAEQGAIDETFDDRVEAIRQRRDAEREEEQ